MNKDDALCAQTDPELFFPVSMNAVPKEAYSICAACPVVEECLDEALKISRLLDHGVWGGTLPTDRARIRKRPSLRAVYLKRLQEEYSEDAQSAKKAKRRGHNYSREVTNVNNAV